MKSPSRYRNFREGEWRLWVLAERWNRRLWEAVTEHVEKAPYLRHPQTIRLPSSSEGEKFYLKIFDPSSRIGNLKDIFRDSKALRALKQGEALSQAGFCIAPTVAVGERRNYRRLKRAFLLTSAVEGKPLPSYLRDHWRSPAAGARWTDKSNALKGLAVTVRRLHQAGFVHGDLVPSNIFVSGDGDALKYFLMDNDRTRRYPPWLPQALWRRNLIQLNRFPLPGVSLQDRIRFLRYYLWIREWNPRDRRLLAWLERKTRQRRNECDTIGGDLSFRRLMRWDAKAPPSR